MELGKYEVIQELGKGGFGVVYLAKDTTLDRSVALKVLHPQLTVDPRFIENFRKEARMMAKVSHPNVVSVYEIGEEDGRLFIAMQYLPGKSLADQLREKGPCSLKTALKITRQVIAGLNAGLRQNLIHRDIKPANILFDEYGNALITDFGVAHTIQLSSVGTMTQTGGVVGTPSYRPPELWNGTPPPSSATDQYSLACVFYEMISGDILFGGDTTEQVLTKHLVRKPEFGENIPNAIKKVLDKAISKDPQDRYQNLMAFYEALEQASVAGDRPLTEQKIPVSQNSTFPPRSVAQPAGFTPRAQAQTGSTDSQARISSTSHAKPPSQSAQPQRQPADALRQQNRAISAFEMHKEKITVEQSRVGTTPVPQTSPATPSVRPSKSTNAVSEKAFKGAKPVLPSGKKTGFFQNLDISNDKHMLRFLPLALLLIHISTPILSFLIGFMFAVEEWGQIIGWICGLSCIIVSLLLHVYCLALIIKSNPRKDIPKIILAPVGYYITYFVVLSSKFLIFFIANFGNRELETAMSDEMVIVWYLLIFLVNLVAFGCWIYFGYLWVSKYLLHEHILRKRAEKLASRGLSFLSENSNYRSDLIELCLQAALFLPILILIIIVLYFMSIYEADIIIWRSLIPFFLFMLGLIVRWVVRMIKTLLGLVN